MAWFVLSLLFVIVLSMCLHYDESFEKQWKLLTEHFNKSVSNSTILNCIDPKKLD